MADYFSTLTSEQRGNIFTLVSEMDKAGITDKDAKVAILAVVSKESNFVPKSEVSYKNTSNARIRDIFGSRVPADDVALNALKANDEAFFNKVYGGRYGNAANEGYKYRGRGYNQLTFKGNYSSIKNRIGVDIVSNPDAVNKPDVASKVVIDYFLREFEKKGLDINNTGGSTEAFNLIFQANRGWGKTGPDTTGGYDKALSRLDGFQQFVEASSKKK